MTQTQIKVHLKLGTSVRFLFYPAEMRVRHDREVDLSKLGVAFVAGAAVILAIRTARRSAQITDARCSDTDLEQEVEYATYLSARILSNAMRRHAEFFEQKVVEFTTGVVDADVQL